MRTKSFALNFGASLAVNLGLLITGFVVTPWLLRWLGAETLGAVRTVQDWIGYLALAEFGFYGALLAMFADAGARGDKRREEEIYAHGMRRYVGVVAICIAVGGVGVALAPHLIPVAADAELDLRLGFAAGLIPLCLQVFMVARANAEAAQRSYVVHAAVAAQTLVTYALTLTAAYLQLGITGQLAALVPGSMLFYFILMLDSHKRHPGMLRRSLRLKVPDDVKRGFASLNLPQFGINVCNRINFFTDNIVVSLALGPAMVMPLVLSQRLLGVAHQQLLAVGNASWAGLAQLQSQGQRDVFNDRLVELTKIIVILGGAAVAPMFAYNQAFLTLWVGADYFAGDWITAAAGTNAILMGTMSLWSWAFVGAGRARVMLPMTATEAALNLTLSIILVQTLGLAGPVTATTVALVTTQLWWLPQQLKKEFGTPRRRIGWAVGSACAATVGYALLLRWWTGMHPPSGWFRLGVEMAAAGGLFLALAYAVLLNRQEKQLIGERISKLLVRRK
jgi:O-antigen/teichoic acid export membrane protein